MERMREDCESTERPDPQDQPNTPPISDAELLIRVQQREEVALGILYDRYGRLTYTIALRITGDRVLAEEVVQDIFQAVWQSAGHFQSDRDVGAWLRGIARHRAIDATRAQTFHARARETVLDDTALINTTEDTSAQAFADIQREAIQQAVAALSPAQRQVIALAYYAGFTTMEIARRLNEPVGTVRSRIRLGLTKLHKVLRPLVDD
jgi:RNA polymerase sigma-70 factor (ECF subfamily)